MHRLKNYTFSQKIFAIPRYANTKTDAASVFPAFPARQTKLMVFPRHLYRGKSLTAVFRTRNDVFRVCHVIKCDLVVLFGQMSTASPMADCVFIRRRNLWCFDSDCSFFYFRIGFRSLPRLVVWTWKNF